MDYLWLDDSRRTLGEKVALLRQERITTEANLNAQDSQLFQHHMTQIRRQMLMHTIEGLKRSLEDQSATLKQTCLQHHDSSPHGEDDQDDHVDNDDDDDDDNDEDDEHDDDDCDDDEDDDNEMP